MKKNKIKLFGPGHTSKDRINVAEKAWWVGHLCLNPRDCISSPYETLQ